MDLPPNQFKRAIKSGQQQIGLWCSLASHISAEMLSGIGVRLAAARYRAFAERDPDGVQPTAGCGFGRTGAPGRAHPVERHRW